MTTIQFIIGIYFNTKIVINGKVLVTYLMLFVCLQHQRTGSPWLSVPSGIQESLSQWLPLPQLWNSLRGDWGPSVTYESWLWHIARFQTSKTAEEQNANKLISHIKQVMTNVKTAFYLCANRVGFVLPFFFLISEPYSFKKKKKRYTKYF